MGYCYFVHVYTCTFHVHVHKHVHVHTCLMYICVHYLLIGYCCYFPITGVPYFSRLLPNEVLVHIFSFLRERELCRLEQVCKAFQQIASLETLWYNQSHYFRSFPLSFICCILFQERPISKSVPNGICIFTSNYFKLESERPKTAHMEAAVFSYGMCTSYTMYMYCTYMSTYTLTVHVFMR